MATKAHALPTCLFNREYIINEYGILHRFLNHEQRTSLPSITKGMKI